MTANEWVNSLDNPTRARYAAARLWQQGLRAGDRTIIQLHYGYNDHDADILCSRLAKLESIANNRLKDFNPDIGF
jgi:hypothetical protein